MCRREIPNILIFLINSVKPTLKKVSKYENKFAKLQKKAAEFNFRNQLKVVKKKEFTLEEEEKEVTLHADKNWKFTWKLIVLRQFSHFLPLEKARLVKGQARWR